MRCAALRAVVLRLTRALVAGGGEERLDCLWDEAGHVVTAGHGERLTRAGGAVREAACVLPAEHVGNQRARRLLKRVLLRDIGPNCMVETVGSILRLVEAQVVGDLVAAE